MIDQPNPTTSLDLCARCTRAEYAGDLAAALDYARRAWVVAADALDRCASAHFIARYLPDPTDRLRWHRIALNEAEAAAPELVATWLPSLYVNLGRAHEALGEMTEAQSFYARATALGLAHAADGPDDLHTTHGSA